MNGSIVSIGVRSIEVLISISFKKKENIIIQTFEYQTDKRTLKYVLDKRFEIYNKVQDKIKELILSSLLDNVFFSSKIEEDNKVIFTFNLEGEIEKKYLTNYYHVVPSFLPPNPGCEFCSHFISNFCTAKNKTILQPLQKCIVFKQKSRLFTT